MAELVLSAVHTTIAILGSEELKAMCSKLKYESQLKEFEEMVLRIQGLLAEEDAMSGEDLRYLTKLKGVIYEADDLLDNLMCLAQLRKGDFSDTLRSFFSLELNPLLLSYNTSSHITRLSKQLKRISMTYNDFTLPSHPLPIPPPAETHGYVDGTIIIGREKETQTLVDKLIRASGTVNYLSIVGQGGLGKTSLAKLVFDNDSVKSQYNCLWVSVSDHINNPLNLKRILINLLTTHPSISHPDSLSTHQLLTLFKNMVYCKKYLVVLDDVWTEKYDDVRNIKTVFSSSLSKGSQVLITTRSAKTAFLFGNGDEHTYILQGLSDEDSSNLFLQIAFGQNNISNPNLLSLADKICSYCLGIPLAINVVGGLLFGQDEFVWHDFEKFGLAAIPDSSNTIRHILNLSYRNLDRQVKACFSFCSLFPRDFVVDKQTLLNLWIAHGLIIPYHDRQTLETAAEFNYQTLVQRFFFEPHQTLIKIHDLMYDLAVHVGKGECAPTSRIMDESTAACVRHLFVDTIHDDKCLRKLPNLRSYLEIRPVAGLFNQLKHHTKSLRAFTFCDPKVMDLPDSIGKMKCLRYLDVHQCRSLVRLPKSLSRLIQIQTLFLGGNFTELPKEFCRLVNLRNLDIENCWRLRCMPPNMDRLCSLRTLTHFYVSSEGDSCVGQPSQLTRLSLLTGRLRIYISENWKGVNVTDPQAHYLFGLDHLTDLCIEFAVLEHEEMATKHEAMMGKLKPPPNIEKLEFKVYLGKIYPNWGKWDTTFPNLVEVLLLDLSELESVPVLGELRHLKYMMLSHLPKVQYIEEKLRPDTPFFPSLERLEVSHLYNLKGWWKNLQGGQPHSFPPLSYLIIACCRELVALPSCQSVTVLELFSVNQNLRINVPNDQELNVLVVKLDDVIGLKALPPFCCPSALVIIDSKANSLSEFGEVFKTKQFSGMVHLMICRLENLENLSGAGFEYLSSLETLYITTCVRIRQIADIAWKSLGRTLHVLNLCSLVNLDHLPEGIKDLTSLRKLVIVSCGNLEALPDSIGCLASLQSLDVIECGLVKSLPDSMVNLISLQSLWLDCSEELKQRCKPGGEDWPKIKHIPDISFAGYNQDRHAYNMFSPYK